MQPAGVCGVSFRYHPIAMQPSISLFAGFSCAALLALTRLAIADSPADAFQAALRGAGQGDEVVSDLASLAEVPILPVVVKAEDVQPQFLFSDMPEYFRTGDGIAMSERVEPGLVRLYVYHVPVPNIPDGSGAKRIVALIDNLGTKPLNLVMTRSAAAPAGGDYQRMARGVMQAMVDETSHADAAPVVIPKRGEIDHDLAAPVAQRDFLVHGWYEFTIDQPAQITVAQLGANDPVSKVDSLYKLPRKLTGQVASGAGRGLFSTSVFAVAQATESPVYDTAQGVAQIVIADGKRDPWITGRDSLEPAEPIANKGNYGTVYHLKLKAKTTNRKSLAVLVASNRGDNKWCQFTSLAVRVNQGVLPAGVVLAPREKESFKSIPNAVMLQKYELPKTGEPVEIEITYTPPGASCLPTPILLVPMD